MCKFFSSGWGMLRSQDSFRFFFKLSLFCHRPVGTTSLHGRQWFCIKQNFTRSPLPSQHDRRTQLCHKAQIPLESLQFHSNQAACNKMITAVQVLPRLQAICIALQLLLLLLPLQVLHASTCPTTVEPFSVATTSDAEELSEALLCDGPGSFVVSWHGNVILSRTLSVSNGSTLNVAGSSNSTDGDSGAVIFSDGTVLLFEVDSGSNVSLTGLTFSGGDGAVRVKGESFVEVIDCSFMDNYGASSDFGGRVTGRFSLKYYITTHSRPLYSTNTLSF